MITPLTVLIALAMLVGMVGIVVPILPGLVIVWLATLVWALEGQSTTSWVVLAIATSLYAAGLAAQYLFPGRRMKSAGVPTTTIVIALVVAVIGFFVIPVVGAPIGFVVAIYLLERARHRDPTRARVATGQAVRAVALTMGIELATGLSIMTTWGVGVWLSRA